MTLQVHNLALTLEVAESCGQIARELFSSSPPKLLHHYTSWERVIQIAESRTLWATSIAKQKDQNEIRYSVGLMSKIITQEAISAPNTFASQVLALIPRYMEERRSWVFIACFCGNQDSEYHWQNYGRYSLSFEPPWIVHEHLKLEDTQADCWYSPVIYGLTAQKNALTRFTKAIKTAIAKCARGGPDPHGWIAQSCARNLAQLALVLSLGFKEQHFAAEEEWRVICCPRLAGNNSASSMADDNFAVHIKEDVVRHIRLTVPRRPRFAQPLLRPPVPFVGLSKQKSWNNAEETEAIRASLDRNGTMNLMFR